MPENIKIIQNFDWNITNKKLCIFMPNYHGKRYTEFSVNQISTEMSKIDDYVIIIGDDNTSDNFDNLKDKNVYYFSIQREDKNSRNGCFVRNYAIKNCQSELFFQKDGEVVVYGDFIKNCIYSNEGWRAGNIFVLNDEQTRKYLAEVNFNNFKKSPTKIIERNLPRNVYEVKRLILEANGNINLSSYFHYAFCVKTKILQYMRGYDEDFNYYGFEDSDMFCRLFYLNQYLIPDYTCAAIHINHARETINQQELTKMYDLFKEKDPKDFIRNQSGDWGRGIKSD